MKQQIIIIAISFILICLQLSVVADIDLPGQNIKTTSSHSESPRKVASIHRRIISSPSSGSFPSTASENDRVRILIDRTIKTLRSFRRVRKSVTAYPKHHLLQPIDVSLDEAHPKQDLNSTTAPFTDNHHSWKKAPVILP